MVNAIQEKLIQHTVDAVKVLYGADISQEQITLQETRKEFEGQITVVTFPITRFSKKSPEQTGAEIGDYLQQQIGEISAFNVIKGFLNISLSDAYWIAVLNDSIAKPDFGHFPQDERAVMVEYASPNTNKPLHLGHVRNVLLGYSVAEILKASGKKVYKTQVVNDRGIHICKSMLAWQKFGNGQTPESTGLKGDKLVGHFYVEFDKAYKNEINELVAKGLTEDDAKKQAPLIVEAQEMLRKWEAGDEEVVNLWKTMNNWVYDGFEETYRNIGVDFDFNYYESQTYLLGKDEVEKGLESGVFYKKEDGSVWIDLTEDGLDEKLVLRSDGTSVYITQDIGTAIQRVRDFPDVGGMVYTVGNEQDYHFKVLFLILKKLGFDWAEGLFHLSYGMVDLPSGKMKSREGTVVDADDLMTEMVETAKKRTEELGKTDGFTEAEKAELYHTIGMGALKYFLLKVDPKKRLLFDPNESVDFQGHTGPFIQYTHARIKSVLRKANFDSNGAPVVPSAISVYERDLIQALSGYPAIVQAAAQEYSPAQIANYVYDVAKLYNKFYHEESILKAEDATVKAFRLHLSASAATIIAESMRLLGIQVPERM